MTMDLSQASQMLKWLDEERQKDKALIAALQERLEAQAQRLLRQEEQLTELQNSVAGIEPLLVRARDFGQAVDQFKAEVRSMLDDRDEQRRKEQRESERTYKLDVGSIKDDLTRLREDFQRARVGEVAATLQAEDRRLNDRVQDLETKVRDVGKRAEERSQSVVYLEEQRQADNRRISTLEGETTDLRKRAEAADAKLLLLEETIQKEHARIDDSLAKLKGFDKTIEEIRVAEFQRQQQVKKWDDQAGEIRQQFDKLQEERQMLLQQAQQNKRSLDTLEAFQTRVDTRQNEFAEMQRMAEDRIKKQWEEWQAGRDKEFHSQKLNLEGELVRFSRVDKEHDDAIKVLEENLATQRSHLRQLLDSLTAHGQAVVEATQERAGVLQQISREELES